MQIQINNFTQFLLSDEEQQAGYHLTAEQRAVIQNDIAECAMKRANIVHDLSNPGKSLLEDAAIKGQITMLQYMLQRADAVASILTEQQTNQDL